MSFENIDFDINPKDDFYHFCNNKWLLKNKIPDKYSSWGTFSQIQENNRQKIKELISNCKDKESLICNQINNLYKSGLDTRKKMVQDIEYIKQFINDIYNLRYKKDIMKIVAKFHSYEIDCLFNINVDSDSRESEINRLHFYHSFLGMPDREYYLSKELNFYKINYIKYIENLLKNIKTDYNINNNYQERIFLFEKKIAKITVPNELKRDPLKTYNKFSIKSSIKKFSNLFLKEYFQTIKINPEYIIFDDINFYLELEKLILNESIQNWKEYFYFCLFNSLSPYLSKYYEDNYFLFYGKILSGQKKMKPLTERSLNKVNLYLEDAVGILFVQKYFNEKSKKYVEKMVIDFKKTLYQMILKLNWMSNSTKKKALQKLENISYKIGYPCQSTLKDYSKLKITNESYVKNILNCRNLDFNSDIEDIDKNVNKKKWHMSPQTTNAYYSPNLNEIVFPAAILQEPFFSIKHSDPQNYGGIGCIIGHELTHAFDDEGRYYDHKGDLNNWWNNEDKKKFIKESNKMILQYNNYQENNIHINGKLTLGENLADYGGIKISLKTMINNNPKILKEKSKTLEEIDKMDDFTSIQKFFISYANNWKLLKTEEDLVRQIKTDPHSPNNLRVNGPLSIIEEFHQCFNVNNSNKLFIDKSKRCNIW